MLMIKTDGMCFPLWALHDPAIPKTFADNIKRLENALHAAGYNIRILYSSSMDRCYWAMDYTPLNVWIASCPSNVGQKIVDEGTIRENPHRFDQTLANIFQQFTRRDLANMAGIRIEEVDDNSTRFIKDNTTSDGSGFESIEVHK
jgi:hypothetical protein